MTDLKLYIGKDAKLNVRVGAIIKKGDALLLARDGRYTEKYPLLSVVGGRIRLGEDSYTALKRELKEELGEIADMLGEGKFVGLDENFYNWQGKHVHEYGFYYLYDGNALPDVEGMHCRDKNAVTFHLVPVSELGKYIVYPVDIREMMTGRFVHSVTTSPRLHKQER